MQSLYTRNCSTSRHILYRVRIFEALKSHDSRNSWHVAQKPLFERGPDSLIARIWGALYAGVILDSGINKASNVTRVKKVILKNISD